MPSYESFVVWSKDDDGKSVQAMFDDEREAAKSALRLVLDGQKVSGVQFGPDFTSKKTLEEWDWYISVKNSYESEIKERTRVDPFDGEVVILPPNTPYWVGYHLPDKK